MNAYRITVIVIPNRYHIGMSTQIAVRLPDDLVAYVDHLSRNGAGSRAAIVAHALSLYRMQLLAEEDASILERTGDYDDFDELIAHSDIDA